jgi:hypothetical protein
MMSGGRGGGREGGGGQKVLSRPSADSFAVGRRQKEGMKKLLQGDKEGNDAESGITFIEVHRQQIQFTNKIK